MRLEGLNQVKLGPATVTNQRVKAQTNLRSDVQLVINVTEQQRLEMSQSQADRPQPVCVEAKQLPPTSGGNQERPREGGGRSEAPPGQPALLVSL